LRHSFVYQVHQLLIIDNPMLFFTADSNKAVTRSLKKTSKKYIWEDKDYPNQILPSVFHYLQAS
jgi:hypothetical protein